MRQLSLSPLAKVCLVASVTIDLAGCGHFHHTGPRGVYAMPAEQRPLEVPPPFVLPTDSSSAAGRPRSTSPQQTGADGPVIPTRTVFRIRRDPADVFDRVGGALSHFADVKVVSQERTIGSYEVNDRGTAFIVRIVNLDNDECQVSVIDARGLPADSAIPVSLLARLKAELTSTNAVSQ